MDLDSDLRNLSESHPLSEEVSSLRALVVRFQAESHAASINLQRHALTSTTHATRIVELEAENTLLRDELAILRANPASPSSSSAASSSTFITTAPEDPQTTITQLTLSLRHLSSKLTLTESALSSALLATTQAESLGKEQEFRAEQAYALAARANAAREEAWGHAKRLARMLTEREREVDGLEGVVRDYAELVRRLEGRGSTSIGGGHARQASASGTSGSTPTLVEQDLEAIPPALSETEKAANALHPDAETQTLLDSLDLARAELAAAQTLISDLGTELAKAKYEREVARVEDRSAAGMVERYMKFTQQTTTSLHASLAALRTRHAATLATLEATVEKMGERVRRGEGEITTLRTALDASALAVLRESVARRREVALRMKMVGREERVKGVLGEAVRRAEAVNKQTLPPSSQEAEELELQENSEEAKKLGRLVGDVRRVLGMLDAYLGRSVNGEEVAVANGTTTVKKVDAGTEGRMRVLEEAVGMLVAELEERDLGVKANEINRGEGGEEKAVAAVVVRDEKVVIREKDVRNGEEEPVSKEGEKELATTVEENDEKEPSVVIDGVDKLPEESEQGEEGVEEALGAGDEEGRGGEVVADEVEVEVAHQEEEEAHEEEAPPLSVDDDLAPVKVENAYEPADEGQRQEILDAPPVQAPSSDSDEHVSQREPAISAELIEDASQKNEVSRLDEVSLDAVDSQEVTADASVKSPVAPSAPADVNGPGEDQHLSSVPDDDVSLIPASDPPRPRASTAADPTSSSEASTNFTSLTPAPAIAFPSTNDLPEVIGVDLHVTASPMPQPTHPLLAELAAAHERYTALQRAFRDCHAALQELRSALQDPPGATSPQQTETLKSAVERLHDYTEDARVELEIRVADGTVLARGWEAIVGLPPPTPASPRQYSSDGGGEEGEVRKQIAAYLTRDAEVEAGFRRKLEDVEHDVAVVKGVVYAPPSVSSVSDSPEPPQPVSPVPQKAEGGWAAWLTGGTAASANGRRTPPSPGFGLADAPTFGSVMTSPRLRHSASAARLASRGGTPHSTNPLEGLGLRVPMPMQVYVPPQQQQQPQPRQRTISGVYMLGLGMGVGGPQGRRPSTLGLSRQSSTFGKSAGDEGDVE
ncbi:hypothetical protein R3P38DRAFT_544485 [Favolaschia claudopus]|uniref:Uncharacterized protein n=1 Tax=Favolaschia claudopus TaxID=2862362 RepID=A0AAW0CI40_9AGAR